MPIAADVKSPVAQAQSIPVPATLRAAIALVPPVVDGEDGDQAPRAAYGS